MLVPRRLRPTHGQKMGCKGNIPTGKKNERIRKKEVEMDVGDWEIEISRPIDCKK